MDSSSVSADSSSHSGSSNSCQPMTSKLGLARYQRCTSADDVLSTSTPHGSPLLQHKFRRLNPFSRSTPRLNALMDRTNRSKASNTYDVTSPSSQDKLKASASAHNVNVVNLSFELEENSKPKRKHVIRDLFARHRKTSLSSSAFSTTRYDVDAIARSSSSGRNASDSSYNSTEFSPTMFPQRYTKTSRSTPRLNTCGLLQQLATAAPPAEYGGGGAKTPHHQQQQQSAKSSAQNSALCGTPDIGASSSAACQTYSDALLHSASFQNFFSKKVKSNLKRTKSSTKLDRRKVPPPTTSAGDASSSSIVHAAPSECEG